MARAIRVSQSAAVPYRIVARSTEPEVLLVTSRTGRWTIPKGGIKPGATAAETARIEALEEAGVLGTIEPALGQFAFEKEGELVIARAFPLRVTGVLDRWEEEATRIRVWTPIAEVGRLVTRRAVVRLVTELRHRLLSTTGAARAA